MGPDASSLQHHNTSTSNVSRILTGVAIGGIALTAAIIAAPYVLPAVGVGNDDLAATALTGIHVPSGFAGAFYESLKAIPYVGPQLAAGGLFSIAVSGAIGAGGVLLGHKLECMDREKGKAGLSWGSVIKYASLATSAIVALPSLLNEVSAGIMFLGRAFGDTEFGNNMTAFMRKTIGGIGKHDPVFPGLGGVAAVLPHFLTCGAVLLPAMLSLNLSSAQAAGKDHATHPTSQMESVVSLDTAPIKNSVVDNTVKAEIMPNTPLEAEKPVQLTLKLTDRQSGVPLSEAALNVVHSKKLHLMVVDQSLQDYHHLHPQPTGQPGIYTASFVPRTNHGYHAWADLTTLADNKQHLLHMVIDGRQTAAPAVTLSNQAVSQGVQAAWKADAPLRQGEAAMVSVRLTDALGQPITDLEPVMGAFAHMAGFSADGKSFIHVHPIGIDPTDDQRGGPLLRFHIEPETAGQVQFYVQIQRHGQQIYLPFGQQVQPALGVARGGAHSHSR